MKKDALDYHAAKPSGKMKTIPTKPHATQRDLSLAYSPGVAYPCLEIEKNENNAYRYTSKGNLVAVITNGTAVLGLGDIGALASKPVMEGKGLLFKAFADIDVFDIEIDEHDVDKFVDTVKRIAPTFGGINLEDIKAPECFEIERRLVEELNIPVMHDDQHGTAIISGAAMLNSLELVKKDISQVKVVVSGAGASAISCANHWVQLGITRNNIKMVDSKGIITQKRFDDGGLTEEKSQFTSDCENGNLADAMKGSDIFLGLSKGGIVSPDMLRSMNERPVIFALANPDPEIMPNIAKSARPDAIVASGRSDFPNQVNNVLGFPYIFRGALDCMASTITPSMKMAATHALANLAKEAVPEEVAQAYGLDFLTFGKEYIIPKPFDKRVLVGVASAVAQAAVEAGVAGIPASEFNIVAYQEELEGRFGLTHSVMRTVLNRAKASIKKIVFPEGDDPHVIRAAYELANENICIPILLGRPEAIDALKEEYNLDFECEVINPIIDPRRKGIYRDELFKMRCRKGLTVIDAQRLLKSRTYFGAMMVQMGDADGFVGGSSRAYPTFLKPCLEVIGTSSDVQRVVGMYMMAVKGKLLFIGDATVNVHPDSHTLAEIAIQTARVARRFGIKPKVAMLSFSNFGSSRELRSSRIEDAIDMARELDPNIMIDGPMQADTALIPDIQNKYPFMELDEAANVLICPNLTSANIAYKLLDHLGDAEMTGPILEGMAKPVQILQQGDGVRQVVHMAAICAVDAQRLELERL
ncbi:MAG: NADP-dependent malic enzyme [Euryarchaeota archaeon]|nr:NADP-dependent malic enzyme [Euryarchaeota archaeon]